MYHFFIVPNLAGCIEAVALDDHSLSLASDVAEWVREGRVVLYITADRVVIGAKV